MGRIYNLQKFAVIGKKCYICSVFGNKLADRESMEYISVSEFAKQYNVYEKNEDIICNLYVRLAKCPTEESLQKRVFSRCDQQILQSNCSKEIKDAYIHVKNPTFLDKIEKTFLILLVKAYNKLFL